MQSQADGSCLRFPEHIGPQREVSYEMAVNMLLKGAGMAMNVPFSWSYIDKPADGTVMLLYLPSSSPFPNDGIRWQDNEIKGNMGAGSNRELEIHEIKFGFIPGSGETSAARIRRRFRLTKGGNPELLLVHYTRGPQTIAIPPQAMNQPVRAYPLRPINEPSVYIAGEKRGLKVMSGAPGAGPSAGGPGPGVVGMGGGPGPSGIGGMGGGMPPTGMGMGGGPGGAGGGGMPITMANMSMQQQQAMLAQQNSQMEALERRRERERHAAAAAAAQAHQQGRHPHARVEDEDSGDEVDQISTRSLALARYKRNHDWMNDVFHQAAFGRVIPTSDILGYGDKPKTFSTLFNKEELDGKVGKLEAEIERLREGAERRRAEKIRRSQSDEGSGMLGVAGPEDGLVA